MNIRSATTVMLVLALSLMGCATTDSGGQATPGDPKPPTPLAPPVPPSPQLPPPPKPEAKPSPKPKPEQLNVEFGADIFFDKGKTNLRPNGREVIDALLQEASGLTIGAIVLTGHSDRSEKSQKRLSEMRSAAVKEYLSQRGIALKLIFWEGKGASRPLGKTRSAQDQEKNRRVEIEVVGVQSFSAQVAAADPTGRIIPVLFGTNRRKTGASDPENYFGQDEIDKDAGEVWTLGRAIVRVPLRHRKGNLERPNWIAVTLERITTDRRLQTIGLPSYKAADWRRHFTFASPIEELDDGRFRFALRDSVQTSKNRAALLYVHGYANTFADAAFRTAQLTFDLRSEKYDVVPVMFSWPSDVNLNYLAARDRARSAGWNLAEFLNVIAESTGVNVVHIVTHSMGAEVLGAALIELGVNNLVTESRDRKRKSKFNQVVLAAPDVRAQDFRRVILPAVQSGHPVTNYASSNDLALFFSKKGNADPRAGDSGDGLRPIDGVDTIDASAVNNRLDGHSFFAESPKMIRDLAQLLSVGAKPPARGLEPRQRNNRTYWVIVR